MKTLIEIFRPRCRRGKKRRPRRRHAARPRRIEPRPDPRCAPRSPPRAAAVRDLSALVIFRRSRVNPEFAEGGWAKIRDAIYEGREHERARQQPPRRVSTARSAPAPSGGSGVGPRIDGARLHPLPEDRDFQGGQLLLGPHRQIFICGAHGFDQQALFHSPGTMTDSGGTKTAKNGRFEQGYVRREGSSENFKKDVFLPVDTSLAMVGHW